MVDIRSDSGTMFWTSLVEKMCVKMSANSLKSNGQVKVKKKNVSVKHKC